MPTERQELTARQKQIYEFIRKFDRQHGYPPTVQDVCDAMKIGSPNGVTCHYVALVKKGWISRDPGKSRAIRFTDPNTPQTALPISHSVKDGKLVANKAGISHDLTNLMAPGNLCLHTKHDLANLTVGVFVAAGSVAVLQPLAKYSNKDVVIWSDDQGLAHIASYAEATKAAVIGKYLGTLASN